MNNTIESSEQLVIQKPKKVMKYWLVEITSTDGEILQFYVKAMTQFDAYEKAEGYQYWLDTPKLKNKLTTFRLMP